MGAKFNRTKKPNNILQRTKREKHTGDKKPKGHISKMHCWYLDWILIQVR